MEYVIIGIGIVAVIAVCAVIVLKSKKNTGVHLPLNVESVSDKTTELMRVENDPQEFVIQIEMLSSEAIPDESRLFEITDSKVLAHVNNLVPGLALVGNAANNAVRAAQANGEILYRAIIPAGVKLTNSKAMEGAVRGIYHGHDGINGHVNLMAVESKKGIAVGSNTTAAAVGVVAMVVGQYYMTQINVELGEISDEISKIAGFQDNEYRSRVFSLLAHVKIIADFQVEIIQNNELRISEISRLDSLEEECTQLLGQANLTLAAYEKKKGLDYQAYEKELRKAQNWYMYQNALLDVLFKISDLRFVLYLGAVTREQCRALLPVYTQQVADTQAGLTRWHQDTAKRLSIDTTRIRRKRKGFDGMIHFLPGLVNDDLNFRSIAESAANMIAEQTSGHEVAQHQDTTDLYAEDVQLISKDGKIYYMVRN